MPKGEDLLVSLNLALALTLLCDLELVSFSPFLFCTHTPQFPICIPGIGVGIYQAL